MKTKSTKLKRLSAYVDDELYSSIVAEAKQNHRTLSEQLKYMISKYQQLESTKND